MANVEEMVRQLTDRVRGFVYQVALLLKPCPNCRGTSLTMLRDSWCRCDACGYECDPTLEFQRCGDCGARLTRKRYHYWCPACRTPVDSRFAFSRAVFDSAYFRQKMRESRERKQRLAEELRGRAVDLRSSPYTICEAPDIQALPGLLGDLDKALGVSLATAFIDREERPRFDLDRYRQHIRELAGGCIVHFDGVSPLIEDRRLDRIYRFITVIFMEHDGEVTLEPSGDGHIVLAGRSLGDDSHNGDGSVGGRR